MKTGLYLRPQGLGLLEKNGASQQLGFEDFATSIHIRIGREVHDQFIDALPDFTPPRMVRIAHFADSAKKSIHHLVGDHVVDPFRDPRGGILRHSLTDEILVVGERLSANLDDAVEHCLRLALRQMMERTLDARGAAGIDSIPRRATSPRTSPTCGAESDLRI